MANLYSESLKFENDNLYLLDQTLLPFEESWIFCENKDILYNCIKTLQVRGAPLIGISAVLYCAGELKKGKDINKVTAEAKYLVTSRPTAVNLQNNVDAFLEALENSKEDAIAKAVDLFNQEEKMCSDLSEQGQKLVSQKANILTHCNTGSLATIGLGTAVGVIKKAHLNQKDIHVYVSETRPLLQGGRLTAWEMVKAGISHEVVTDNMCGFLMKNQKIDLVVVGADRITKNGDVANKIGTYSLSVLAKHHNIPFYVAAPDTTYDPTCKTGNDIEIEQRNKNEVRGYTSTKKELLWVSDKSDVYNPAFDITPSELITGYILPSEYYDREKFLKEYA